MASEDLHTIQRKLITANHILHYHGIVDAYGHISVRHPTDPTKYLMCGYMAPALVASPADLITYHVSDSEPVDTSLTHKGYSERFIHGELFRRFSAVNCVIHSHAEDVLPYVVGGVPMHAVYHMAGFLGTNVPCWDIDPMYRDGEMRDMLVNNARFGKGLAECFGKTSTEGEGKPDRSVVLMRRHGFTVQAHCIETAVYRAIYTKLNAKAQTDALATRANFVALSGGAAGGANFAYDAEEDKLALTEEQCKGCSIMCEKFQEKPWKLWVKEVERGGIYVNRLA